MNATMIINPISGASKQQARLRELMADLQAKKIAVQRRCTTKPGDARQFARCAAGKTDAVIVVGGDGTVCEVADGLAGSPTPIVIWPTGTENLVAKSLGFKPSTRNIVESLQHGPVSPADLGFANGRAFMVVAGIGFDAEVVHRVTRERKGHITHLSYFWPLWRTFWEHRWPMLIVHGQGPGGPIQWQGQGMVFVGNMARYALGLPVVRDARPDDGFLDLCILPCRNPIQLIGHSWRTLRRKHIEYPDVIYTHVERVQVTSPTRIPVEIDGEATGWLPLDISTSPQAIRFKLPPRNTWK